MRFILGFILGIAAACSVIYSGTMQWLPDYLSSRYGDYWSRPPLVATSPDVAPPVETPPPVADASPPPYGAPAPVYPGTPVPVTPDPIAPVPVPPDTVAPTGPPPYAGDRPLAIQVSLAPRTEEAGCYPAYTLFNETRRPIVLSQGQQPRDDYREPPRGDVVVQPGGREVACADLSRDRPYGDRRLDYFNPYERPPDYGNAPPPAVNIRVRE